MILYQDQEIKDSSTFIMNLLLFPVESYFCDRRLGYEDSNQELKQKTHYRALILRDIKTRDPS